jgi:NADH:ubiquinone oxidoreductase subunit K
MTETAATLLVAAACLFGVGLFALIHRRDAMGAVLAVILGFDACACGLVGFAGVASSRAGAAQLQAFALVVEVTGALFAAAGVSLAAVLRRRTGGADLLELALLAPPAGADDRPGQEDAATAREEAEAGPQMLAAVEPEEPQTDPDLDSDEEA